MDAAFQMDAGLTAEFDTTQAKEFINAIDLTGTKRAIISQSAATEASAVYDQAKAQALVVGSGLFSFAQGVDNDVREAISDSALLAQLVANKNVAFNQDPIGWFDRYDDVLENVGWTLQDRSWTEYNANGTSLEVNEQIVAVMTALLGSGATALSVITATVNALKQMQPSSSWLTIFSRETQKANIARFQIGLADTAPTGDVYVTLAGFILSADQAITQVLFFNWQEAHAHFQGTAGKVSINRPALVSLGPSIRSKVRAYQSDYVSSLIDL
jgi:hypothetical protein